VISVFVIGAIKMCYPTVHKLGIVTSVDTVATLCMWM